MPVVYLKRNMKMKRMNMSKKPFFLLILYSNNFYHSNSNSINSKKPTDIHIKNFALLQRIDVPLNKGDTASLEASINSNLIYEIGLCKFEYDIETIKKLERSWVKREVIARNYFGFYELGELFICYCRLYSF